MNQIFYKRLLMLASFLGITGVAFGAFGAHFLKARLGPGEIDIIRTAVLYLFVHTLAIMSVVLLGRTGRQSRILKSSGVFFVIGIILFSGSLILIATRSLTGVSPSYFGFVTPIGGLFFIVGWILLFIYGFSEREIT